VSAVTDHYDRGNRLYEQGRYPEALQEYQAAAAALTPADDAEAADLYENLGVALWQLGRWRAAARAFLRVLDGQPTRREQSLRLLVSCLFRDGAPLEGERLLAIYEQAFGRHPEEWSRVV
jgi:tetratricopeptide (TPR) repeat protein